MAVPAAMEIGVKMKNGMRKTEMALVSDGFSLIRPALGVTHPLVNYLTGRVSEQDLCPETLAFFAEIITTMSEEELRFVLKLCERQLKPNYLGSRFSRRDRRIADEIDDRELAFRGASASDLPSQHCRWH